VKIFRKIMNFLLINPWVTPWILMGILILSMTEIVPKEMMWLMLIVTVLSGTWGWIETVLVEREPRPKGLK